MGGAFRENCERCIRRLRFRTNSANESKRRERTQEGEGGRGALGEEQDRNGTRQSVSQATVGLSRDSECGIRLEATTTIRLPVRLPLR